MKRTVCPGRPRVRIRFFLLEIFQSVQVFPVDLAFPERSQIGLKHQRVHDLLVPDGFARQNRLKCFVCLFSNGKLNWDGKQSSK